MFNRFLRKNMYASHLFNTVKKAAYYGMLGYSGGFTVGFTSTIILLTVSECIYENTQKTQ